jgi:hypothetical protein
MKSQEKILQILNMLQKQVNKDSVTNMKLVQGKWKHIDLMIGEMIMEDLDN